VTTTTETPQLGTSSLSGRLAGWVARARETLPQGRTLPEATWRRRHRALLRLLWLHVPIVLAYGLAGDSSLLHAVAESAIIAAIAGAATFVGHNREAGAALVSIGLLTCSAVLIHLSGGFIELHFHFFVMVVALTLYEDWIPFLAAIAYVALHHGVMGTIDAQSVYNHPEAQAHPWRWALIHAGFILAAATAAVAAWRLNEEVREHHRQAEARAREAERAQAAAVRELERSNADLQQFAYVASHDLQEPLRTVAGFMQLLQQRYEGKLDSDADEFIGFAVDGAKRMQTLIDDLLTWSRVGSAELRCVPVDLNAVVAPVLQALHGPIERARATVEVEHLPRVLGDDRQLGQLLQNLISNGVKFSRNGHAPLVRVQARRSGGRWVISVVDNGVGLDREQRARAFKMFTRLHHEHASEGTGIGLAICQRIVERHSGEIWIDDGIDGGTAVRFTVADAA
jgi:signal transduction histidine kinase